MKNIEIETFATWEMGFGILGTSVTPLILQIDIKNNTNAKFDITGLCVSVKTNLILFDLSKDILYSRQNVTIAPKTKFTFKLDIRHIQSKYSNKKFKIKVFGKDKNYESDKLSIKTLKAIQSQYI